SEAEPEEARPPAPPRPPRRTRRGAIDVRVERDREEKPERDRPRPADADEAPSDEEKERPSRIDLPEPDSRRGQALAEALDPAQVARESLGPGATAPSATDRSEGQRPISKSDELSQSLYEEANAKPWLERTEPELTPGPGGTYRYAGHVFDAVIQPDGTVRFDDDGGEGGLEFGGGQGMRGGFDLNDAVASARGEDPHAAERAWFLRETREMRDRMAAEHREQEVGRGLAALRARLFRLWEEDAPAAERRRRLFEKWDECSEDGMGTAARQAIVEFVRRHLPEGSADAFTAAELRRLNARRRSRARFAPYASTRE
ncbi:MAG: hypothetical protein ACODAU_04495, partial [Myxococcota bacterium]